VNLVRLIVRSVVIFGIALIPALVHPATDAPASSAPAPDAKAPGMTATPRPAISRGTWLRVDTPDFTLLREVPEARLRLIAGRLETFRAALEWLHPGSLPSPRETTLYVFKEAKSAWPFTPARAQGDRHLVVNRQYDVPNYVILAAPIDDPPLDVLYQLRPGSPGHATSCPGPSPCGPTSRRLSWPWAPRSSCPTATLRRASRC
jgi:hypothetical protein